jgi:hypothetical protein
MIVICWRAMADDPFEVNELRCLPSVVWVFTTNVGVVESRHFDITIG